MSRSVIVFALALALALAVSVADARRPRRDEPADETTRFEDLSKKATDFIGEISGQINRAFNAKDADELQSIFQTNTDNFISKVADLTKSLQAQISKDANDPDNVVGKVVARLNQTIADLQDQNPEATQKAKERLSTGLKTVVEETDKLAKSLDDNTKDIREDLAKLTKKSYDQVLQTVKGLQQQLHEAANKDEKA